MKKFLGLWMLCATGMLGVAGILDPAHGMDQRDPNTENGNSLKRKALVNTGGEDEVAKKVKTNAHENKDYKAEIDAISGVEFIHDIWTRIQSIHTTRSIAPADEEGLAEKLLAAETSIVNDILSYNKRATFGFFQHLMSFGYDSILEKALTAYIGLPDVQLMFEKNDLNSPDNKGKTLLMQLLENDFSDPAIALIEKYKDALNPHVRDDKGVSVVGYTIYDSTRGVLDKVLQILKPKEISLGNIDKILDLCGQDSDVLWGTWNIISKTPIETKLFKTIAQKNTLKDYDVDRFDIATNILQFVILETRDWELFFQIINHDYFKKKELDEDYKKEFNQSVLEILNKYDSEIESTEKSSDNLTNPKKLEEITARMKYIQDHLKYLDLVLFYAPETGLKTKKNRTPRDLVDRIDNLGIVCDDSEND